MSETNNLLKGFFKITFPEKYKKDSKQGVKKTTHDKWECNGMNTMSSTKKSKSKQQPINIGQCPQTKPDIFA